MISDVAAAGQARRSRVAGPDVPAARRPHRNSATGGGLLCSGSGSYGPWETAAAGKACSGGVVCVQEAGMHSRLIGALGPVLAVLAVAACSSAGGTGTGVAAASSSAAALPVGAASSLEQQYEQVVARVLPSVVQISASGGKPLPAQVVGVFAPDDLAVIRVAAGGGSLHPASFGRSASVRVGEIVLA